MFWPLACLLLGSKICRDLFEQLLMLRQQLPILLIPALIQRLLLARQLFILVCLCQQLGLKLVVQR